MSFAVMAVENTPTARLNQSVTFADDLQFQNLDVAINRQLEAYNEIGVSGQIKFGKDVYSKSVLRESLQLLKRLTEETKKCLKEGTEDCLAKFNQKVNDKFAIYTPVTRKASTKYTSYYSPDLTGSRVKSERFKHAIYRWPDHAEEQNLSRVDIDFKGALDGKGYEIFWVENSLFDIYLLHVQGGGRINIINPDGSREVKYLSYEGKNSRSFQMIYKYMIQRGYLASDAASVNSQRKYLEEHPEKQEEIFGVCPSYVFFKETSEEPVGLDNIPLTEGRSLAIDTNYYHTTGLINFVVSQKADHVDETGKVVKVPFSRFFISQDTGGAIKGPARCDLYFGYGPLAELTAYNMNEMGEQYFLVKKSSKADKD